NVNKSDQNFWRGRPVLVTGADGFIGSHLTEALTAAGAQVTALALYNSFDSLGWLDDMAADARAKIKTVRGDVRDPHQMTELCRGQDTVFHLAALIAIPFSYEAPASYVETNVRGAVNMLTAAHGANVRRFVQTSTSEVYGTAQITPISESHPLQAQSPYAASKIAADAMTEAFHRSFGMQTVTLRPFNTFGPRQSQRAVIGTVIRQALDPAVKEIRTGDLSPKRDFTFVADTARAFMAAAALDDTETNIVYNAGGGRMVTIGETVECVRAAAGTDKPVVRDESRVRPEASEVMALMADSSRFQKISGWRPETAFEDGVARTVAWWRARIDRVTSSPETVV
ncbi:MAG: SDR family NAD(P)-dependent oxidoreductase, partial [Rhodospirillales bacterium]